MSTTNFGNLPYFANATPLTSKTKFRQTRISIHPFRRNRFLMGLLGNLISLRGLWEYGNYGHITLIYQNHCCRRFKGHSLLVFFQYLDCLWQQIKRLRSEMWVEKHIVRPYLAFDSVLCEALQHNLPPMVPPPHHPSTTYPLPQVIFRMFDYTDCPEVCYDFPR